MKKSEIREVLENNHSLSDEAYTVLDNIIDDYNIEDDDDFQEALSQKIDWMFICWADAFDYLKNECIFDFKEAINEFGAVSINQIACYYLEQEIREAL